VLRAWEAVSTERSLQGVLEAVSNVIQPAVPFNGLGIIAHDGIEFDLYAVHIVGVPHLEGESMREFFRRTDSDFRHTLPAKPMIPYPDDVVPNAMAGIPFLCPDLYAKPAWLEHEFHLARSGIRSYASLPLLVRNELIGLAVFSRLEPLAFSTSEVETLQDASRALAVAVSNALANEELARLRDELQAENVALRTTLGESPWYDGIVGDSREMRLVLARVETVAPMETTVLVTGETGTGKELIARAIHRRSLRAQGPLVKVNCAAIPESLLASELFGHERGAFTGAIERRKGRFEQAHGGTLFLDEVGELSPEPQAALLRVVQERELERVGGSQTVRVDVRIVAATNRDLEALVREGRFREDLFYRLNVFPIHVPPLRERKHDIPLLTAHFALKHGERCGRPIETIDTRTLAAFDEYAWPGNVRELENIVERAVILSRNGTLRWERDAHVALVPAAPATSLTSDLEARERATIEEALRASRGRVAGKRGAAARLGLPPSTLEFRIKRLGIDKFRYRNTN
jgi:formate hydrogenlyase transcriptional activator